MKDIKQKIKCVEKCDFLQSTRRNIIFLLFSLIIIPVWVNAQTKSIEGMVVDFQNESVIGASVVIKGTTTGMTTDVDGKFSISAKASDILVVSYIGFETKEVPVGNSTTLKIIMNENLQILDEVVVVGYGTQKRANLTGSVAAINNEQLVTTKNPNVQNMLTGKLPGVRVIQKTSEPGQFNNQFDIRGFGSPLIVVDGIPRGDFERLDPNEVESISILKDASASIYGVASSNGVVLITTKQGEQGKQHIEYSMYYGLQFPSEVLRPVGSFYRMTLLNEKTKRGRPREQLLFSDQDFENLANGITHSYDWYEELMRTSAPQQQHNLSLRGGNGGINYFVNLGYFTEEGFFKTNDLNYSKYNLRTNLTAKITNNLKANVRMNGILDIRDRPNTDTWRTFSMLWRTNPSYPFYANNNPLYPFFPNQENALVMANKELTGYKNDKKKIFQSSIDLVYDVPYIKGLTAKALFSFDTTMDDNHTFTKSYKLYNYDPIGENYNVGAELNTPQRIERYFGNSESYMGNISLNYDKALGKHKIDAMLLYEESRSIGENFSARRDLKLPMPYLSVGMVDGQVGSGSALNEYTKKSVVGRLNYTFQEKYLVEASFRYDGSSKFLPGKQWDIFPSVNLGWRISEEGFIKHNLSFVDNLKIRATYGKLGTDSSNLWEFLDGYNYPGTGGNRESGYPNGVYFGDLFVPTVSVRATPNPDITWVSIYIANAGVDVDLWRGRLGISADVFQRDRKDLYARRSASLPAIFGSDMPQENLDSDRTKGFELELKHRNRISGVGYNLSANLAFTRSMSRTVTRTPDGNSYSNWRNNTNNRYNDLWWGKGKVGQVQTFDQAATNPVAGNGGLPGDFIYEDWNGDGVIDGGDDHPIATTISTGSGFQDKRNYPLMNFGLTGGANYKGFDFDFLLQGSAMSYVSYGEQLGQSLAWDGNALGYFLDRWRPADRTADPNNPNIEWISGYYAYGSNMADINSRFMIQNGAYIRLKSASIGYTFPKNWLSMFAIDKLRIYVNVYNLFTITGVKGLDPEKPTELYGYMYPLNKTVNFGASVQF